MAMEATELKEQLREWSEMIRQIPDMQNAVKRCLTRHLSSQENESRGRDELNQLRSVMAMFQQKYAFDIIFVLNGMGSMHFNDLRTHLGDVNPTTLSKRLKDLENWGFVTRTVQQGQPIRVNYELTTKGNGTFYLLLPMLVYVKYAEF
jgi:DNA-binding HxlR family transcriptional regulator